MVQQGCCAMSPCGVFLEWIMVQQGYLYHVRFFLNVVVRFNDPFPLKLKSFFGQNPYSKLSPERTRFHIFMVSCDKNLKTGPQYNALPYLSP